MWVFCIICGVRTIYFTVRTPINKYSLPLSHPSSSYLSQLPVKSNRFSWKTGLGKSFSLQVWGEFNPQCVTYVVLPPTSPFPRPSLSFWGSIFKIPNLLCYHITQILFNINCQDSRIVPFYYFLGCVSPK